MVEVPITFVERERASSKMSRGIVWEAAVLVPRLRRVRRRARSRPGRRRPPQLVERDGDRAPEVSGPVE